MAEEYNPFQSPVALPKARSDPASQRIDNAQRFVSGSGLALCTMLLLGIVAISDAIGCWVCFSRYDLIASLGQNTAPLQSAFEANDENFMVVLWGNGFASLLTMLAFLAWTDRVYRNLPALGNSNPQSTPFWAVAWYFVPIANLAMPCKVMSEIWAQSDPAQCEELHKTTSPLVGIWWCSFLLSAFVEPLIFVVGNDKRPSLESVIASTSVFVAAYGLELVAAFLAICLVNWIDKNQQAKIDRTALQRRVKLANSDDDLNKFLTRQSERRSYLQTRPPKS